MTFQDSENGSAVGLPGDTASGNEPTDRELMEFVWIKDIRAAFETLLEKVGRECDTETVNIVHWVMLDVLAILAGERSEGDALGEDSDANYLQ